MSLSSRYRGELLTVILLLGLPATGASLQNAEVSEPPARGWGGGPPGHDVRTITIDPITSTTLYVTYFNTFGVFKSMDGGSTWITTNSRLQGNLSLGVVIDPSDPAKLYSWTDSGIFKTINAGRNWARVRPTGLPERQVSTLAIDPLNPRSIYVGIYAIGGGRHGVFRSTDEGETWTEFNVGLPDAGIGVLVIDPQNPTKIYVGTSGLFRTLNSEGRDFRALSNFGSDLNSIAALAINPSNPSQMYASYHSIYVGQGSGVSVSADGGETWRPLNSGLVEDPIFALAIDPNNTRTIYAGAERTGVFKSTDGGESWMAVNSGLADLHINALAIDPLKSDVVYAGTAVGLFKSTDGGTSWQSSERE